MNPYAGYTPALMYEALEKVELTHSPGEQPAYSNWGIALLGYALASHAGTDYEALLKARLLEPLGMTETAVRPTGAMLDNLAVGTESGRPSPPWDDSFFVAAGGLRSTAHDVLRFLAANMRPLATPLGHALQLSREAFCERLTAAPWAASAGASIQILRPGYSHIRAETTATRASWECAAMVRWEWSC